MKKILYIICTFCLAQTLTLASYTDLFIANIEYDWINKTALEKEEIIKEIYDIIFEEQGEITTQNDFRSQIKDRLKDKKHWDNFN